MQFPLVFVESIDIVTLLLATSASLWLEILLGAVGFILFVLVTRGKYPKHSKQKAAPPVKLSKKEQRLIEEQRGRRFLFLIVSFFATSLILGHFVGWYLQERVLIALLSLGLLIVVWMLAQFKFPKWVFICLLVMPVVLAVAVTSNQGTWVYPDKVVHKTVLADKGIVETTFVPTDRMQLIIYCYKNKNIGAYRQPRRHRVCGSYLNSPTVTRFGVSGDINIRRIDEVNAAIITTFNLQCTGSYKIDENPEYFEVVCRKSPTLD